MHLRFTILSCLMACVPALTFSSNTGKIAGTVKDSQTGEPIAGATIIMEGTKQGAATNIDGYYVILNIPPGKYTLSASGVGYTRKSISNVSVSIDLTTTIDFALGSTVLQSGEEITIVAERPLIQKDLTAKTAVVGGDEIRALPVTEVSQVLSLQAGFVAGSLRGGRSGEVAYWIDGVPVTDAYDGSQVVEINKSLVQELQLVSGAFNAEYGQAMSGIVNIATKEGGQKFTGSLGVYGGEYASTHTSTFPGISDTKPNNIRNVEGSVSGPVIGEDLTFFANARYIYFDGWLKGIRKFNPQNISTPDSSGVFRLSRDPSGVGDGAVVPMNWSERRYGQGKLTWHVSPVVKASVNYIYDNTTAKRFDGFNDRRLYFYNPDGFGNNYDVSNTVIMQISHTLSSSTFYTVGGSWFQKDSQYHLYDDPHDPRYVQPDLLTQLDQWSFYTGGTDLNRFHRATTTWLAKVDLTSQFDEVNLVKVGAEVRRHKLFYENYTLQAVLSQSAFNKQRDSPYITTQIPSDTTQYFDTYTHNPIEASAYVQDKLEFNNFILNIGLRFDYFQPDGVVLNDDPNTYGLPYAPYYTVDDPNVLRPIKDFNKAKSLAERLTYWYKKAKAKYQFSPRIGASFPITARGVVHFSYGHFFQVPRFENLYENPSFKLGLGTGNQGLFGNADLKPEETINGELGIQQQVTDDIAVDLTAYIRDIRNLTASSGDAIDVFGGSTSYTKYVNRDFGYVRGIVLTVDKHFAHGVTATLDYTFQVARGTASDPQQFRNAVLSGALPEVQLTPLGWDQRHTLNISLAYNAPVWGASLISRYGSGTPYTPGKTTSQSDISSLLTNSETKPSFFNVDARAFYEFNVDVMKFTAFLRVFNLLDNLNELDVYTDTGTAGFTLAEQSAQQQGAVPKAGNTLDDYYRQPRLYSEPRRIEFGINMEF